MTKPSDPPISFHFNKTAFSLRNRKKLKHFIAEIFKSKKKRLDGLVYVFSTDRHVLKINRQYLNHDFYTDVITFNLSDDRGIDGEVYLSVDRIKENAKKFDVAFSEELHRVIFHAALHLCGYADRTDSEKVSMRKREDEYLNRYFQLFHVKHST